MSIPFPNKKYSIILADPPWAYDQKVSAKSASDHYDTSDMYKIAELPVNTIAAEDCLLFMWVTGPTLTAGNYVAEKWGFKYVTIAFNWHKLGRVVNGFYTMSSTELVLVFKKGKIPKPRGSRGQKQFLETEFYESKQQSHSEKPAEIRNRITRMFPEQSKIELFARHSIEGWDSWGNQVGILDKPESCFEY